MGSERLTNLPKDTQLLSGRAWIWTLPHTFQKWGRTFYSTQVYADFLALLLPVSKPFSPASESGSALSSPNPAPSGIFPKGTTSSVQHKSELTLILLSTVQLLIILLPSLNYKLWSSSFPSFPERYAQPWVLISFVDWSRNAFKECSSVVGLQ